RHYCVYLDLHSFPTRRSSDLRLELNPVEVEDLIQLVKKVVTGKENIQSRLAARPKITAPGRNSHISPMVRFSDTASDRATLLERSEEHTSELQSRENLVCRLL